MKKWVGMMVFVAALSGNGVAHAIEGFSGSTWGTTIYNFGHDDFQTLGNLNQGIDWFEARGYRFSTFASLRWRYQSNEGRDFNAWGPALGVSVRKWSLRLGAEYYWEYKANETYVDNRALLFMDWYYAWDLKKLFK